MDTQKCICTIDNAIQDGMSRSKDSVYNVHVTLKNCEQSSLKGFLHVYKTSVRMSSGYDNYMYIANVHEVSDKTNGFF